VCAAAARLLAKHTDTQTRGGKVIWPLTDKAQLLPLPAARRLSGAFMQTSAFHPHPIDMVLTNAHKRKKKKMRAAD
jgi:hypothetical protein